MGGVTIARIFFSFVFSFGFLYSELALEIGAATAVFALGVLFHFTSPSAMDECAAKNGQNEKRVRELKQILGLLPPIRFASLRYIGEKKKKNRSLYKVREL